MANMDVFERYFQIADVDRDGRISGQEAVTFFKASGLPQMTLAKVWQFADFRQAGFLTRPEFFNALKLVTVAQTGRDLTPEVVHAALNGPAAAQIPPPQMNLMQGTPGPNLGPARASAPAPAPAPAPAYGAQASGPRAPYPGQSPPGTFPTQFPPQQSFNAGQFQAPGQPGMPQTQQGLPSQGPSSNQQPRQLPQSLSGQTTATNWPSSGVPPRQQQKYQPGPAALPPGQAPANQTQQAQQQPKPQSAGFADFGSFGAQTQNAPKVTSAPAPAPTPALASSPVPSAPGKPPSSTGSSGQAPLSAGKGPLSEDLFAGPGFSAGTVQAPRPSTTASPPTGQPRATTDGSFLFAGGVPQQGGFGGQQPGPSASQHGQPKPVAPAPGSGPTGPLGPQAGSAQPQQGPPTQVDGRPAGPPGTPDSPKMTVQDAQRYTQIFAQIDTDRDHKITGGEARNLFLQFGLQREILKRIWDLSDQDKDGMLSHREFCTAMYLIERFREGRQLPATLPPGIHVVDEAPSPANVPPPGAPASRADIAAARMAEAQAAVAQNNKPAPWRLDPSMLASVTAGPTSGQQPQGPVQTAVGQMPVSAADASAATTGPLAYRSKVPPAELSKVRQLAKEEQESIQKRHKDAEEADRKVWSTEAELLDSKQKIDFYRTKMQEIIMFKSRCDNRLNEITERAAAEKREVAELAKKYDEKYKQTEGVANRLLQEDSALRDLQEKKTELHKAVTRLMEGAPSNSFLQEKADKLASELEDLRKVVNKRAKQLGLTVRPLMGSDEVPFGWQPGLQENAVEWDDEWHDFDDEGFATVEDIGDYIGPISVPLDENDPFASSSAAPLELAKDEAPKANENGQVSEFMSPPVLDDSFVEAAKEGETLSVKKELSDEDGQDEFKRGEMALDESHERKDLDVEERNVRKSDEYDSRGAFDSERGMEFDSKHADDHGDNADEYVESEDEDHPEHYGQKGDTSLSQDKPRESRYAGVADSQDFGGSGAFEQQNSYSSGNSTSFHAESSAADTFGDGGPTWSAFGNRNTSDDEADSGVRASWGLQSNPPSTQVSTDFGRDSTTFNRGFVEFGDRGRFDNIEEEERNGSAKKVDDEEEEEDNDPFTALFKKRAASYTSLMSWDKSTEPTDSVDRSGFGSFGEDARGFGSHEDDTRDEDKLKGISAKPTQNWSSFD